RGAGRDGAARGVAGGSAVAAARDGERPHPGRVVPRPRSGTRPGPRGDREAPGPDPGDRAGGPALPGGDQRSAAGLRRGGGRERGLIGAAPKAEGARGDGGPAGRGAGRAPGTPLPEAFARAGSRRPHAAARVGPLAAAATGSHTVNEEPL